MGQSPCCGSSRAKEQGNARAEELRSGGAAWKAAARGAGGAGQRRAAQRGAGAGAARARALARGAAAKWSRSGPRAAAEGLAQEWRRRSGVRARVQGGGFARRKKNSEADAWARGRIK